MARKDAIGMVELKHVANIPWCMAHGSFALNLPTGDDGGSCVAGELLLSESPTPNQFEMGCDFTTAHVLVDVRPDRPEDPHAGGVDRG